MSDAESTDDVDEWIPGESDEPEPELARVGRLLLAYQIDQYMVEIRDTSQTIIDRAHDGEDIRREDVEALRNSMKNLEFTLRDYADPVVEDDTEAVDLATVTGEASAEPSPQGERRQE